MRTRLLSAIRVYVCAAFLLIACCAPSWAAGAPRDLSAAEILERYIAATGGRSTYARITSLVMTGTLSGTNVVDELGREPSLAMQHGAFESYWKAPGKRLNVRTIAGFGTTRFGYDGRRAWSQVTGHPPREITGAALVSIERSAALNPTLDWQSLYKSVKFEGTKRIGGRKTYVVRLTRPNGESITDYFAADTFLLIHSESYVRAGERSIKREIEFSDYREVDGMKFPFFIRHTSESGDSVARTTSIRVNVPVDDSIFEIPKQ